MKRCMEKKLEIRVMILEMGGKKETEMTGGWIERRWRDVWRISWKWVDDLRDGR